MHGTDTSRGQVALSIHEAVWDVRLLLVDYGSPVTGVFSCPCTWGRWSVGTRVPQLSQNVKGEGRTIVEKL